VNDALRTDVAIIGSGQAAAPLATRLAGQGQQVVVIERAALGGTCVNTGCTPTKTMIASARAAHVARTGGPLGIRVSDVQVDLAAVVDRKNAIVARWRQGVERRLGGERIKVLRGHARFVDGRTLQVGEQRVSAGTVIVNVGARPVVPALPGLDGVPWKDNASVMELRQLPRHLLVLGGGYIGCEMAQMFRRFGALVTVVGNAGHLLPQEDEEVSAALEEVFTAEGIELRLGTPAVAVERGGRSDGPGAEIRVKLADGARLSGSHLLVATGRRPNTDDLGCEAAGIERDEHGHIKIDDRYRTSAEGVYALGDAVHGPQFTHVSWDDHRRLLAVLNGQADAGGRAGMLTPFTVFTDPQVAGVGLSERQARQTGQRHESASMPFGDIARAIESGQTAGVLKVLVDPDSERLLGARIVGAEAGELIHVFAAVMRAGASARTLVDGQMVHPTFAEGVQSVLMKLPRFA
jgi:pyruvate/2-oxoglutarate dehydrogenase complex dihydrolipoamide dehydrogenase (E3) component